MSNNNNQSIIPINSTSLIRARNSIEITTKLLLEISEEMKFWDGLSSHWKAILYLNLKASREDVKRNSFSASISDITYQQFENEILSLCSSDIKEILLLEKVGFASIIKSGSVGYGLEILSSFKNLSSLLVAYNGRIDPSSFSNLSGLLELSLLGNLITELSSLHKLIKLKGLLLSGNKLTNIDFVCNLINLEDLTISHENITSVSPIKDLDKLITATIYGTRIKEITALANKENLKELHLVENHISDLYPLTNLPSLVGLEFRNYCSADITAISSLPKLEELILSSHLTDIKVLCKLKNLKWLKLTGKDISSQRIKQIREALPNCLIETGCKVI